MSDPSRRPPLWPAYLATFTFMLGSWATSIAVPLNLLLLGGSLAEAGVLAALRFGLQAFLQLPFGAVIDAWGTRRVLFIATTANALVNVVPVLAVVTGSILPLYAWAVLSGITASLFLPSTSAYIAASAEPRTRGSAFGWLTLFTHTGVASGPAVGGVLWDLAGPAPTYVVAGLLGGTAAVAPFFVPASVRGRVRLTRLPGMVAEVGRQRAIVGSWLAALAIGLPWGAVSGLFPLFGTGIGLAAGTVGLLMASQSVANGLSRVPLGRTIDRLTLPPIVAAVTAGAYGLLITLLGFQTAIPLILLVLVSGIVMLAFTLMLVQVTISEVARPEVRATGLGGYGTALSAGLGLGPALGGAIADAGGFGWAFAAVGATGVAVAAVAALVLARTRRRPAVAVFDA